MKGVNIEFFVDQRGLLAPDRLHHKCEALPTEADRGL